MSEIPIGFIGMLALRNRNMTLAEVIQEAVDGYNRLFSDPADICYVLQKDLDQAIDDDRENGQLAEVCGRVKVMPIQKGLPGHHVMAGRRNQS